jgi:hypothetical protein
MRKFLVATLAICLVLGSTGPALADPDAPGSSSLTTDPGLLALITDDDLFSVVDLATLLDPPLAAPGTPTQHYGPFPSSSPDSSTCGNDWAQDTFDRHFTVRTSPGMISIVEQFKNGSFVTAAGASPGGCDTNVGGTITAGKTGSMHGYFVITGAASQTSNDEHCNAMTMSNANCTTTTFLSTHFVCVPFCDVTTFFFHYAAGDQSLALHEWKNASCDRGGNDGDIANNVGVRQRTILCP